MKTFFRRLFVTSAIIGTVVGMVCQEWLILHSRSVPNSPDNAKRLNGSEQQSNAADNPSKASNLSGNFAVFIIKLPDSVTQLSDDASHLQMIENQGTVYVGGLQWFVFSDDSTKHTKIFNQLFVGALKDCSITELHPQFIVSGNMVIVGHGLEGLD